jgi:signal transduction histidine kinase
VSHELRTPVAGVLGFLQTSLDHWDSMSEEERRSAVERANANARRLQVLTRDVLDATAVERGELSYNFLPVDLGAELGTAVTAMRELQPQRDVVLEVPEEPVRVRADADRLMQVVMNLFDNAVNSSPPESPITVRLVLDGGAAVASLTDRGRGLSVTEAGSLFDKFTRGRSTTRGSGLGLYLVREIVTAHGGTVWGEPAEGGGTTFSFKLPLDDRG